MKKREQSFKRAVIEVVVTVHVLKKLNDAKFKQIAKKTFPAKSGRSFSLEACKVFIASLASVARTGPARNVQLSVEDKKSKHKGLPHAFLLSIFLRRTPRVASKTKPANSKAAPLRDVEWIAEAAETQTPAEIPLMAQAILRENLSILATHEKK